MNLKDIIAAKKAQQEASSFPIVEEDNSDLFFLTYEPLSVEETQARDNNLLLLCILINNSGPKSGLFIADNTKLKVLAEWLAPFPLRETVSFKTPIPTLYQSHSLWQTGRVINLAPVHLWRVFHQALIYCYKNSA